MLFSKILGQEHIKSHLLQSVNHGRVPHAQLFVGPEGSGTLPMAIAYAKCLLTAKTEAQNDIQTVKKNTEIDTFSHPDLHFVFPVNSNDEIKVKHPTSKYFLDYWRKFLDEQPYGNLFDWYKILGIDNKQGNISVHEAADIYSALSLKAYQGGYKVMIIWMAEKMNSECANKLLKLVEEPPNKTVFILVAEDEEQIINTIRSRCQLLHFPSLSEDVIKEGLMNNFQLGETEAAKIAHQANGNYNKACDLVYQDSEDIQFEEWFVFWIRSAFKAKGNKSAIHDLITWSETVAKTGRETQKQFLQFCLNFFRQAMLLNYSATDLVYLEPKSNGFKLENFAPFIHNGNIIEISNELSEAIYHIERNGNSKLILTDLSIKLTRLLHKKPV
ncbi:ATP-binding protein [Geojedonia litorea]|uniref:ATP-binding protein n=1 Tax=Geojedonia litorea TaxID=1268269 RepID=A0ABV9N7B9_9FLAO